MSSCRFHAYMFVVIVTFHLIKVLSCGEIDGSKRGISFTGLFSGPYFDPTVDTNITSQLGTHAYLPCKVLQLSNKSVSWIRRRDGHILTVDRFTFIADERFRALFVESTNTWTLQIKYVQVRDSGLYECQISTEPKTSHFVQLNVIVPKLEIAGESEVYVKAGSTVELRCVISSALQELAFIFWYHNGHRVLDYNHKARNIRVERLPPDTTIGHLTLYKIRREDSGNYSCSVSNLDPASMLLHVLTGEEPAAIQHGNAAAVKSASVKLTIIALVAIGMLQDHVIKVGYNIAYKNALSAVWNLNQFYNMIIRIQGNWQYSIQSYDLPKFLDKNNIIMHLKKLKS